MNLEFKAKNIRKMERETGKNFFDIMENFTSISNIVDVLIAGGLNEDEATDAVDNRDFNDITIEVMRGLSECGFLPEKVRISMKKSLAEIQQALKEVETSAENGKETNQKPLKSA